ncbi:hypothetical protein ASF09_04040 [Sphingomonas sp. Leaf242]|nr:hypothetical protein ASF09_04040 [Sphingomonas sp. Leaf242]
MERVETPVEGDIEGLEARTLLVRQQFDANMVAETEAYNSAEDNQAFFLSMGYDNALDWLANKAVLYPRLAKIGVAKPAQTDAELLGQIAKLQLGRWVGEKFVIPSRRDERLGRFYRIFFADPVKFPRATLHNVILAYPKRSGGILADAKPGKVTVSKEEKVANRKLARGVAIASLPLEDAPSDINWGKVGEYRLLLVRVEPGALDICDIIKGQDALTERWTDQWTAAAALSVPSSAA